MPYEVNMAYSVLDADELDVEDEHPEGCSLTSVGQRLGNPNAPLLTFHHELKALRKAWNQAVYRERRRLAACA